MDVVERIATSQYTGQILSAIQSSWLKGEERLENVRKRRFNRSNQETHLGHKRSDESTSGHAWLLYLLMRGRLVPLCSLSRVPVYLARQTHAVVGSRQESLSTKSTQLLTMKSALIVTLAASLTIAQDLSAMPPCAKDCVSKYMGGSSVAGCQAADIACVCKNKDFLNNIACCLAKACKPEDQAKTISFAKQLCSAAGVQVPDKVECNNEAAASVSTSSSSSSATHAASTASAAAAPMMAAPGLLVGSLLVMLPAAL
ncbi:hypothetical protein XA68_13765 [Ophiocordyceps unilateralis]|uniref:CFEM domain-containing protein n=1 Tax=Ophiocordyceps unilateralis TaxID=268505 RepID=A0A2A9PBX0_OPHUN|nr:hypothetical protein XA68_13765 [Ophiocordyceps unilateralis]